MKPSDSVLCQKDNKKADSLNYGHLLKTSQLLRITLLMIFMGCVLAPEAKSRTETREPNLHEEPGTS